MSTTPLECKFVCYLKFKQISFLNIHTFPDDCSQCKEVHWRHMYSRAEFGLVISKSYLNFLSKMQVLVFTKKTLILLIYQKISEFAHYIVLTLRNSCESLPDQDNKVCVCLLFIS